MSGNWGGFQQISCMDNSMRYNIENAGGSNVRFATQCRQPQKSSYWLGILIVVLLLAIIGMICAMVALQRSRASADAPAQVVPITSME